MKLQKVIVGFIGIIASVIIGVSTASAATFYCSSAAIEQISVIPALSSATSSKYAIKMFCEDNTTDWEGISSRQFLLIPELGAAGYAMALTAMTSAKKVSFYSQGRNNNALVIRLHIQN